MFVMMAGLRAYDWIFSSSTSFMEEDLAFDMAQKDMWKRKSLFVFSREKSPFNPLFLWLSWRKEELWE